MKTRCYLDDKEVTWPMWEIQTRGPLSGGVGFLKVSNGRDGWVTLAKVKIEYLREARTGAWPGEARLRSVAAAVGAM